MQNMQNSKQAQVNQAIPRELQGGTSSPIGTYNKQ